MASPFNKQYYRNDQLSDVILVCQNREWPGHRMILCHQSSHIHNRTSKLRGIDLRLTINDLDATAFHRAYQFFYLGEYEEDETKLDLPSQTRPHSDSRVLYAPTNDPAIVPAASSTTSDGNEPSDLEALVDVSETNGHSNSMAEICTDLAVLDINRPAPFASAEIARAWCHVQMFSAANYLQAKDLSEYAYVKLNHVLDGLHVYAGFQDLVERTLDLSRRSNGLFTPLLSIVNECAINIKHLFSNAEFRHLLQKDRQLAFLVLSRVIEKHERADSATEELKTRLFEISDEAQNINGTFPGTLSTTLSRQPAPITNGTHDSPSNMGTVQHRVMELKLELMELEEKLKQNSKSNRDLRTTLDQRDLALEKAEKDNAGLQTKLEQRDPDVAKAENDKAALKLEIQTAAKAYTDRDAEIRSLHEASRVKSKHIEELGGKVKQMAEVGVKVEGLETALSLEQAQLRKLNETCMKKTTRIRQLEATTASKENVPAQVAELGTKIKSLEAALASRQAEVRQLHEALSKKNTEAALASREAEIRNLNQVLLKKSTRIHGMEAKVQAASKENIPASPKKGLFTPLGLSGSRYATPSESDSSSGAPYTPQSGVKIEQGTPGTTPQVLTSANPRQKVTPTQNAIVHASNDVKAQLDKMTKQRDFLQKQLSDLRLSSTPVPSPPITGLSGSASKKKYDEALKLAAKDYKGCNDCGIPFNSEFRGAPEDPSARHLALSCTKCGSEQMRWPV
ncbi:hypothetical protein MBLNU457_5213t1 [Dothideomycetes sp. NU457]